MVDWFNGV